MPRKLDIGKIMETTPSGQKINRYCMQIVTLNTPQLKRLFLHGLEQARNHGQQAAHIFKDAPRHYYAQITAEAEDAEGNFERLRPDNHAFDCEATQYAMISRELHGGVDKLSARRPQQQAPQPPAPSQATAPNPFTGGTPSGINPYTGR